MKRGICVTKKVRHVFMYITVASLCVLLFYFLLCYKLVIVNGNSMQPTLSNGEIALAKKMPVNVKSDDIIVFRINNEILIKRVVAVAGDNVIIDNQAGIVYVNGIEKAYYFGTLSGEIKEVFVSENSFFVIGDNYNDSIDSRSDSIGLININCIEAILI